MIAAAAGPNVHGSFDVKGLEDECSRLIGDSAPNWNQRTVSSSSREPNMCPPTSWLHQP